MKNYSFPDKYFHNYAVCCADNSHLIKQVQEKPKKVISSYYGLGFMAMNDSLVRAASHCLKEKKQQSFFKLINDLIMESPQQILGFLFQDIYVNVNTVWDVFQIRQQVLAKNTCQPSVDLIIPAWNERESIAYVVKDFLPYCRRILVMDNESEDGTAAIAKEAGATVYSEPLCGYGDAIKKGLDRSNADILVIAEADGTFRGQDLTKLLTYLNDCDAIIGSRTNWHYIECGANMKFIQRIANITYGLIITLLWYNRKSRFTDVGCSYRAFWRHAYKRIAPRLVGTGPEFAPEITIEFLNTWQRVIEVPVPYHRRLMGKSKFSDGFLGSAKTALRMLRMILWKRWIGWMENLKILAQQIHHK